MRLNELGWDEAFARHFSAYAVRSNLQPARVAIEFNHNYRVYVDDGELDATATGRLKHRAESRAELPAVGDWVAIRKRPDDARGAIVAVLPRRSWFSRRMAGQVTDEQVVAANVDVIFIVMGLDGDFSLRRLERYLLLARESGAAPVIVLTKPDLAPDLPAPGRRRDRHGRRRPGPRGQSQAQPGHRPRRCVFRPGPDGGAARIVGSRQEHDHQSSRW